MALGGFANRVARIDLTNRTISYEGINEEDARKYIGARGLGVKYLLDNGPETDPNSPDNMLAVVNGPLTGTEVTMSGRLAFVTKSPLTGTVTDSHMGGWSAARLRWAGFDALLITGKADSPRLPPLREQRGRDSRRLRRLGPRRPRHRQAFRLRQRQRHQHLSHGDRPGRRERHPLRIDHERRRPRRVAAAAPALSPAARTSRRSSPSAPTPAAGAPSAARSATSSAPPSAPTSA